ncbi:MAG TPA: glycosyltransferase family 4 protein [Vicinamibacterales bacterium]|nr:glycosyltransferase family 4 protein [Vicinamibacterales bacterium]
MPRLAWFGPMPPARSGVAVNGAEVVAALRGRFEIDVFADEPIAAAHRHERPPSVRSAHDFVWMHRRQPYDLAIYQLGNSSAHDFLWPYLFRYPGLAVLHDAHLHHARAAALLRLRRAADYRAEFVAAHPDVSPDAAELAVAGFDSYLYYAWPMTRLVAEASRVTAVHASAMAPALAEETPEAIIDTIRLGHGEPIDEARAAAARAAVIRRHDLPPAATLFAVFGGLTPEKRVPQVLAAFAALLPYAPSARLLLVGAAAAHYDVLADVRAREVSSHVTITGHVDDETFTEYVAACDVSLNLRWPTAREMSGPWLRAIAAGRPTITMDLVQTAGVPSLDPRTWTVAHAATTPAAAPEPVTVAIDVLDEEHSLRLAMRRLAADPALRDRLGRAAAAYWRREHSHEAMLADYDRVIARALATPDPPARLPAHLRATGEERLHALLAPFGVEPGADLWSRI